MPTIAEILARSIGRPQRVPYQPDFSEADYPEPSLPEVTPEDFSTHGFNNPPPSEADQDRQAVETAASKYRLSHQMRPPEGQGVAYDITQAATGNKTLAGLADLFAPRPPQSGLDFAMPQVGMASKIPSRLEDINPNAKVELDRVFRGVEGTAKDPTLAARWFEGGDLGPGVYATPSEQIAGTYGGGPKASLSAGTRRVHAYDIPPLFPEEVGYLFGGAERGSDAVIASGNGIELWRGPWRGKKTDWGNLEGLKVIIGTPDSIGRNQVSIRDRSILKPKAREKRGG